MNDNPYRSSALDRPETFFTKPQLDQLAAQRMTARIIVGALIAGMVFFFIITTIVGGSFAEANFELSLQKIVSVLAVGYALVAIVASLIAPKFVYKKTAMAGAQPTDQEIEKTQVQYQTEMIISSALLEGAAFFCLIAFMIESSLFALIGAAACLFFLVLKFPKEDAHLHDIQRRLTDHT